MAIEAVVFDADGVLQGRRPGFVRGLLRLGGPGFALEVLRAEVTTLSGHRDLVEVLDGILRRRGLGVTGADLMRRWLHIRPDPEALALVARLRAAGVRVALGTNQQSYRGTYMREHLGYPALFDASFYSHELGAAKPDREFFVAVADGLGLPGDRILFIDDLPGNVRGARRAGLVAAWHLPVTGVRGLRRILRRHGVRPA